MALINPDDLKFRSDQIARLSSIDIDTNILSLQQTSLASSNSLVYKSASYSVNSNTSLPNPSQGYFNSRTIQSGIYYPFQDGSSFVFNFSDTDYGYYASASSTNRWWSVLSSVETAYEKRLCISEIGVSYNYWEFKMDSLSFTNSTWIFSGQKVLGPTYSDFEPEKQFTIGYSLAGGMTASGVSSSISGQIVDGYTTLNYPLLSETMYVGDPSSQIQISITGSSFSATGSVLNVGGDGIAAKNLVVGDGFVPGKITIGGFIDGITPVPPIAIMTKDCYDGSGRPCACWTYWLNWFTDDASDCDEFRWASRPGSIGPAGTYSTSDVAPGSIVLESPTKSDVENGIIHKANLEVSNLLLGATAATEVGIGVIHRFGIELKEWQPDLMLFAGRHYTTPHSTNEYEVGLGIYNVSTSHFEITPTVYTSSTTNIHMYGTWSNSGTHSTLIVESDAVSVNKLLFGDVTNGQSIYVQGGDLYVNDVVFSGGGGSQGPIGPTGAAGSPNYGTQSFTDADIVSVTHSFGRYPIIQVMDTTYDPPQMFSPTKIEYTTIDSFLVTFATSSSGILIYMC